MDVETLHRDMSTLAQQLTEVRQDECLWHYVDRMVEAHGCSRHWFTERWVTERATARAAARPPGASPASGRARAGQVRSGRARTLRWLKRCGGYCDCEVLMNALTWPSPSLLQERYLCPAVASWLTHTGCDDEDCDWVDCEEQDHGARPLVPGPCSA